MAAVAGGALAGWGSQAGITFAIVSAALAILGMRAVLRSNQALVRAEQENARLAVDHERNRLARDLHDILGHSLTVITVKAELAQRLLDLDVDPGPHASSPTSSGSAATRSPTYAARSTGYRELTLPGELTRARAALAAAEIEARLPELGRGGAQRAARALRLDGARGRHQRDPALRRPHLRGDALPHRVEVRDDGAGRRPRPQPPRPTAAASPGCASARAAVGATVRDPRAGAGVLPAGGPRVSGAIRLLLADDQALVRGALAALLGLEPDLEVVAEVGLRRRGAGRRARAPPRRRAARRGDARPRRHRGDRRGAPGRAGHPGADRDHLRAAGLPAPRAPGRRRRLRRQGHPRAPQLADAVRRVHAGLRVVDPVLAADTLVAGDSPLTPRESEVLRAARDGASVAVIASRLFLSEGTVRNHLSAAIGKTGATNRAEAVLTADGHGWL